MLNKNQIRKEIADSSIIIDAHTHVGISSKACVQKEFPYCLSFEDLVLRMDCLGIQKSCIFPFPNSFYYEIDKTPQKTLGTTEKFSASPYELENRNLLIEIYEVFSEYSDRALPFLMFDPSRKVTEQVEVMEYLISQYPVFGLKTCTHQTKSFINDLSDKGQPIIEFAQKHNLPILCHSSYYHGDIWANVYDILKIVENNPEVRFCIAHAARFANDALEKALMLDNCFVDSSAFDIHCILAQNNNDAVAAGKKRFPSDYTVPQVVFSELADMLGPKFIWGSDVPFNHCFTKMYDSKGNYVIKSLKSAYDKEFRLLESLDTERRKNISYSNTLRFLFWR